MSLYRQCNHDHDIKIYHGTRFLPKVVTEGRKAGMNYFLVLEGALIKQSSKLSIVENAYTLECKKKHSGAKGRFMLGKHQLVGGKVKDIK